MNKTTRHARWAVIFFSLILFIGAASTASAQYIQIKAGGGLAKRYGHSRTVGAYRFGVGYELEFDQHWSISPSLSFYGKGWKDPDISVLMRDEDGNPREDENGNPVYGLMNRSTSACYIELPVLLNYYWRLGPGRYIVAGAGPYASVGVAGKMKVKGDADRVGSEKLFYEGNTFSREGSRRFDTGVRTMLGYRVPSRITVGLEADWGFLPTIKNEKASSSFLISLTYTLE